MKSYLHKCFPLLGASLLRQRIPTLSSFLWLLCISCLVLFGYQNDRRFPDSQRNKMTERNKFLEVSGTVKISLSSCYSNTYDQIDLSMLEAVDRE